MTKHDNLPATTLPGALEGLRVLDFSAIMAGPYASRWLSDMGAEVVKIEPIDGEMMRTSEPWRSGHSAYFGALNAGKLSVALNLKNKDVLAAIYAMVKTTDVVVENFRVGVMDKLGLGYETLRRINPRLVYCSITGYGKSGPAAEKPAYAQVVHAASGFDLANLSYQDDQDKPANCGTFPADVLAASFAVTAIQAALLQRVRTGVGQHVDVSLMESIMSVLVYELQQLQFPENAGRPVWRPVKTTDGFVIVVTNTERNFHALCDVIGNPDLKSDSRFATALARAENAQSYATEIQRWAREHSTLECIELLESAGVPCSRYLTLQEALSEPQIAWRGSLSTVSDSAGRFKVLAPPFQMTDARVQVGAEAPTLGQHTREVLAEWAGLDTAAIEKLLVSNNASTGKYA